MLPNAAKMLVNFFLTRILALDGIIGLIEEGIAVIDDGVVKVGRLGGFTRWDYARV